MGKNMTKKKKKAKALQRRKTIRAGVLSLLVALGLGTMVGMAMFNANARPQRDMKWYVRDSAVQVAAPAMGEGYAVTTQRGSANGPALAIREGDPTPRPTIKPTMRPALVTEAPAEDEDEVDPSEAFDALSGVDPQIGDIETAEDWADSNGTVRLTITAAGDCTFGG